MWKPLIQPSQVPRRLFSFWSGTWRRAWGGAREDLWGKEKKELSFPALLSCHASPQSPVLAAAGTGERRETTGDLASDEILTGSTEASSVEVN